MITENFIPYEEALALKTLGFDEDHLGVYGKLSDEHALHKMIGYKFDAVDDIHFIKAPLYQQAFKFFREKYTLHPLIDQTQADYRCSIVKRPRVYHHINGVFDTCQEAELACIRKLIEIANQSK